VDRWVAVSSKLLDIMLRLSLSASRARKRQFESWNVAFVQQKQKELLAEDLRALAILIGGYVPEIT
jgi:hypothetical protein